MTDRDELGGKRNGFPSLYQVMVGCGTTCSTVHENVTFPPCKILGEFDIIVTDVTGATGEMWNSY